jgi:hypothetical protein
LNKLTRTSIRSRGRDRRSVLLDYGPGGGKRREEAFARGGPVTVKPPNASANSFARVIVTLNARGSYDVTIEERRAELIDCAGALITVVAEDGFEPPTHGL